MKSSARFSQDVIDSGWRKVDSCRLTKESMCQVIRHLHTIPTQELVLVVDPSEVFVRGKTG